MSLFDTLKARADAWHRGELDVTQARAMLDAMSEFLRSTEQQIDELEKLRLPELEVVALDDAIAHHRQRHTEIARTFNSVILKTRKEAGQKSVSTPPGTRWERPPNDWGAKAATHDWGRPVMEGFRFGCCDCGAPHIFDFRITTDPDGTNHVEYRCYADLGPTGTRHNDEEHANGRSETAARAI
jgi:hypothetical protein